MRLQALTLWRPWPWAIIHAGKDVENRVWPCPLAIGTWYAIHAGKKWDESAAQFMRSLPKILSCPTEPNHPTGIVALVRHAGHHDPRKDSNVWRGDDRYGWKFDRLIPLPRAIPCGGAQKLWTVDPEDVEKIREEIDRKLLGFLP